MSVIQSIQERKQIVVYTAVGLSILILAWVLFGSAFSQPTAAPLTASISEIIGEVLARISPDREFEKVVDGLVLEVDGQVKTLEKSTVRLDLSDGAIVRLAADTLFTLEGQEQQAGGFLTRIKMESGKLWVILNGGTLEVETSVGVASVRGSYMSVEYRSETDDVLITCLEGICSFTNGGGSVTLTAGQTATATNFETAPEKGLMDHEDVQVWLDANPEATLVVVPLTSTPTPLPTNTPIPDTADDDAAQPTNTPAPPATATSEPTPEPTNTPPPPPPPPPKEDNPPPPPPPDDDDGGDGGGGGGGGDGLGG